MNPFAVTSTPHMNARQGLSGVLAMALCALVSSSVQAEPERIIAVPSPDDVQEFSTPTPTPRKDPTPVAATATPAPAGQERLEVTADGMEYDGGLIHARGNVVITKGQDRLTADQVTVNRETEDAEATGNVTMQRGGSVWTGEKLAYNFRDRSGNVGALAGEFPPYRIEADHAEREGEEVRFQKATVTTCNRDMAHAHYRIRAKKVTAVEDDSVKARGCVLYLGPVPIFYLPYVYRSLNEDFGFRFAAGYGSHVGAFLLSSYRYHISGALRGETHVDYRSKRGVAFGQDFRWRDPDGTYKGEIEGYYLKDDEPWDDDDDPLTSGIEEERYRLRFRNTYNFTDQDYSFIQADYLSDTDILEDFFEDEYRASSQPDNYASVTHTEDNYTASILARMRLNDFYEAVDRLPELSLDMPRQQLGESIFYYEGEQTIANLERVYPEGSGSDDYAALRMDSMNTFYLPTKQFDFLNFTPRAGVRGTYYDETPGALITNSVTVETNSSGVVSTNVATGYTAGDSEFRGSAHFGFETSFKAYRTWDGLNGPRRHIVEPYADYTLVPEPSVTPDELYQFDEADAWGEQNFVKLGNRHKLQKKDENGNPMDLIDADVYTIIDLDPLEEEDTIQNLYFDTEFTPNRFVLIDAVGYYDTAESELNSLDSRLTFDEEDYMTAETGYRYVVDDVSQLSEDLTYYASEEWALNGFVRYNLDDSRVEEFGGGLQRNLDCLSWRLAFTQQPSYTADDGTEEDDEFRLLFDIWVHAMDKEHSGGRYRN